MYTRQKPESVMNSSVYPSPGIGVMYRVAGMIYVSDVSPQGTSVWDCCIVVLCANDLDGYDL